MGERDIEKISSQPPKCTLSGLLLLKGAKPINWEVFGILEGHGDVPGPCVRRKSTCRLPFSSSSFFGQRGCSSRHNSVSASTCSHRPYLSGLRQESEKSNCFRLTSSCGSTTDLTDLKYGSSLGDGCANNGEIPPRLGEGETS
ncbi:hypothetical protein LOK49_LG13G02528 [Camellia lanceoleosa]|uniref:Uncharacterized protein n=1 Tax=Camellia lanceoleosa TaxID=1840588 RepID=A0ACC0FJG7_9ERIC|nr:hypothetical protein LOK49_LG13G02528 [Camellia lanceoleosa]